MTDKQKMLMDALGLIETVDIVINKVHRVLADVQSTLDKAVIKIHDQMVETEVKPAEQARPQDADPARKAKIEAMRHYCATRYNGDEGMWAYPDSLSDNTVNWFYSAYIKESVPPTPVPDEVLIDLDVHYLGKGKF